MAGRPEEFPVKMVLGLTQEMAKEINDWRRKQPDLPNKSESIRRLVVAALRCGDQQ